ncbi:MAG: carboxypeptidase regulatory-like domain-containing protein [Halodesulfurarchaeum sp.]
MSSLDRLRADERGIEGLPIRLIIAFVVGVATLSIMLNMLSGVQSFAVAELDAQPQPDVIGPESQEVLITAVGSDGTPVTGATVLVKRGSAQLDGVAVGKTGANGTVSLRVSPSLGPNQAQGTLTIDVKPPAGSKYMDKRENAEILVVRGA